MCNYLLAIFTLVGTIVGVGIFAIPFVTVKSGIIPLIAYFIILSLIQYFLYKIFAEIVLSTKGRHRLPGYAEIYLGKTGKKIALLLTLLTDFGVIIAYIIVGGLFAHQLLNPIFGGSLFFYTTILFFLESVIVYYGLGAVARSEFFMTAILIGLVGFISWRGLDFVDTSNYTLMNWKNVLLPYGPIFFAVGGMVAIPEICQLLKHRTQRIKSAIAWGTFISVVIMLVFIMVAVGITGANTTEDTLSGFTSVFQNGILKLCLAFGILVVVTSMITAAQGSKEVFSWDYRINKTAAWVLACFIPYTLYLMGIQDLMKVISFTGSVSGGLLGIVVILILFKIKKKCDQESPIKCPINKIVAGLLITLFILGFVYELWNVFIRV